jgi:hypothetical protein
MGYRSSWIAVQSDDLDGFLAKLGWARTATSWDEHIDPAMVGFRLGKWSILFADGRENRLEIEAEQAQRVSTGTIAVFLTQTDGDMVNEVRCFNDGQQAWAVIHDAKPAIVIGKPPHADEIRARRQSQQDEQEPNDPWPVDYLYEVAIEVALRFVGFHHSDPTADGAFHQLAPC